MKSLRKSGKEDLVKIPLERIGEKIFIIRGQKIILVQDLSALYEIPVKVLIQSVKRNISRFPPDFMFQLSKGEFEYLKSQFVTSSWGGIRRALPYAFTEHGVAMLASVLKSKKAIDINILIVRTFVRIREILASNKELAEQIEEIKLEQKLQNKYINSLFSMFNRFLEEPSKPKEPMGFRIK